jgi:hypothetical protein
MLETCPKPPAGHGSVRYFCRILTEVGKRRHIFVKLLNIKFHTNSFSVLSSRFTCRDGATLKDYNHMEEKPFREANSHWSASQQIPHVTYNTQTRSDILPQAYATNKVGQKLPTA